MTKSLPSSAATVVWGFAFRYDTAGTTMNIGIIRASGALACAIQVTNTQFLRIVAADGATIVATGTTTLNINTWYYIEVKCFENGGAGSVTVQLDGVAEIAATAGNFGAVALDAIQLFASTSQKDYDDMYVVDTGGGAPRNDFLGDVTVETIRPNADGAHSDWTPNAGTVHFDRVDETLADGDTTYNSSSVVSDRDSYGYGSLAVLTGTIYGVQTNLYARKDDASVRQLAAVARVGGTDFDGSTVTLSTSYIDFPEIRATNPAGGEWDITSVNAAEFGVVVIA